LHPHSSALQGAHRRDAMDVVCGTSPIKQEELLE
jgi:hypothetical protein